MRGLSKLNPKLLKTVKGLKMYFKRPKLKPKTKVIIRVGRGPNQKLNLNMV